MVTVSDGVSQGERDDESGDEAERLLRDAGFGVVVRRVVPDEQPEIEAVLRELTDRHQLVVTTGGTGFGPRDVTPEATRAVIEREAPGLAELMRATGLAQTPMAALSRAAAGALGSALILNLPGSPRGVRESLSAVLPVLPHAMELLGGARGAHPTGHGTDGHHQGRHDGDAEGSILHGTDGSSSPSWVEVKAIRLHGAPPCRVGNAMSIVPGGEVHGTLGCAEFDAAAVEAAVEVQERGEPEVRTFHHADGDVEVFLEPHRRLPRLVVVSATDVARALRAEMERQGRRVVLVEPRSDRVSADDGPVAESIAELAPGRDDEVVFTDHDAPGIADMLAGLLRTDVSFVGVMGSRRHVAHYVEELRSRGFTDEELGRIRSPLGLDLGGRRPEEIALSIAAGLVAASHGHEGGWLDR